MNQIHPRCLYFKYNYKGHFRRKFKQKLGEFRRDDRRDLMISKNQSKSAKIKRIIKIWFKMKKF